MPIPIEPIFDSEDELWFAGTRTGLPSGPWSQRGEFYAWPSPDGSTEHGAEAYESRELAEHAADALRAMSESRLRVLSPDYFGGECEMERDRR